VDGSKARWGGARLVNNAYEVLGTVHAHNSLSQPERLVNRGCAPDGGPPGAD